MESRQDIATPLLMLRQATQSLWSSVLMGMVKETAEGVPDELFSQISSALAKDPNANITEVFAQFIENSPELLAAIALTGGAMEGKQAWSENQQLGQTPPPLPDIPLLDALPENQTPNGSFVEETTAFPDPDAKKVCHMQTAKGGYAYVFLGKAGTLWLDRKEMRVPDGGPVQGGDLVTQAAMTFAVNNGMRLRPDPRQRISCSPRHREKCG